MNSMMLIQSKEIFCCGAVGRDRKGFPEDFPADKILKRGDHDLRITDTGIVAVK